MTEGKDESVNAGITFLDLKEWFIGEGVSPAFAVEVCMRAYRFGVKAERERLVKAMRNLAAELRSQGKHCQASTTASNADAIERGDG